jgi:hypothetical protein
MVVADLLVFPKAELGELALVEVLVRQRGGALDVVGLRRSGYAMHGLMVMNNIAR